MADRDDKEDVEIGSVGIPTTVPVVRPAPPTILEQVRLGDLDLFRTELQSNNHPLDFKAGRDHFFNRTPLHLAAMEGHEEIVKFILSHPEISREVVNAKDDFGYTPLHLAVRHSHESVVRLLTTSSWLLPDRFLAATNEPDDLGEHCGGYTPLHVAAARGYIALAKLLLRQPCQVEFAYDPVNIFAMTWRNLTPLDLTRQNNFPDLEYFLEASDLNWLLQERERCSISVNAVIVGAALVAAATFVTWMQPPGGIPAPDPPASGVSGTAGAPSSSPSSRFDRKANSGFYLCVSFAFATSVMSLVSGVVATFKFPKASLRDDLCALREALKSSRTCLLVALAFLIVAFVIAGLIVYDKVASTGSRLIIAFVFLLPTYPLLTIAIGFCSRE